MEEQKEPKDKYSGTQTVGCLLMGIFGIVVLTMLLNAIGWMASDA